MRRWNSNVRTELGWGLAGVLLVLGLGAACGEKSADSAPSDGSDGSDGGVGGAGDDGGGAGVDGGGAGVDGGEAGEDGGDSGGDDGALPSCRAADGDAFDTLDASVDGDSLAVTVAYSGGCADHAFTLCWPDALFLESEPVQTTLELLHDGMGDACEAYPSETRTFDLTPLAEAWRASYGAESGEITIHIHGQTVAYRF